MKTCYLIYGALAFISSAGVARAQLTNPFTSSRPGLTSDDLTMVISHSNDLNRAAKRDSHTAWTNPVSGNGGTIALVRHVTRQSKPCNVLHYTFTDTKPRPDSAYNFTWCQIDDEWKLAN